ncbi:MAG: hypothetical protein J5I35_12215 [Methanothrix harundinacea]|nr:hypothetical protein [Methanothrix harundinacea]
MEGSFEVVIKWLRKLADDIEAGTAKPGDLNISSEMREEVLDFLGSLKVEKTSP